MLHKLNERLVLIGAVSLTSLALGYIGYSTLTKKKYVLRSIVAKLVIYPIKSLPGVEVSRLEFERSLVKYGNFYDRSWILIDENGRMITMRTEPKLAKIKMKLLDDGLELNVSGMPILIVPNTQPLKKGDIIHSVNIWGEELDGQQCSSEINNWFCTYLEKKVKLIKHHSQFGYRKSKKLVNGELKKVSESNLNILYSDGAPLQAMNNKSIENLNDRIREEHSDENPTYLTSDRFRPNVIFSTDQAFEEDKWKFMKIGTLEFQFLIECGRCKLTTLNVDTLQYEKEPLRTLKKYRLGPYEIFQGAPKLGVYFKPMKSGQIEIGDDILASI